MSQPAFPSRPSLSEFRAIADPREVYVRTFCLLILFAALSLRLIAFAMDNSAEAATSSPAAQTAVQITR